MGRGNTNEESILTEARKLKQQAERKSDGLERIPLLEKCSHLFQNALNSPLSTRDREDALFHLGEVFLLWSSAVKKAAYWGNQSAFNGTIKKFLLIQMQHEASIHAASLCRAELAFASSNSAQTDVDQSWTSACQFYERAFNSYKNACSRADVKVGDDLAGLLQNWGAGLLSFAEHTLDIAEAAKAFKDAEEKMKNSANFCRLDISIHIALGELFSMQADRFSHDTDYQPQVLRLLEKAINEGYGAALEIDATNLDALIGLGEVCSTSRKHFLHLGDTEKAKEYSMKSLQWYMRALHLLEGGWQVIPS